MEQHFPYACDPRFRLFWWPLGLRPDEDGVRVDDEELVATYGRFRVATPLANVEGAHITRGYRWWTAVGVRLSFVDDGLTFGTNDVAGVCIHFRQPVPRVMGLKDHSALTVTVEDLDGLVATLGDTTPRA